MATKFITISTEIMHDKNLSANQKFILAEIEQLTQLDKGCVASNQHFSELIGIAKESVSRCISDLESKGYITCEIEQGTRNHVRSISLNKMLRPPKQNVKTPLTKHQESKENKTINKTINKEKSIKKENLPTWLDKTLWASWVEYREEIKKPLTPSAIKLQLKFLSKHQHQQEEIINQSIQSSWAGLFEVKQYNQNKSLHQRNTEFMNNYFKDDVVEVEVLS